MANNSFAPWSQEQVDNLNRFQRGPLHPFTCPNHERGANETFEDFEHKRTLVAAPNGWHCPTCDYVQNWAHDFMTEWIGESDSLRDLGYKF